MPLNALVGQFQTEDGWRLPQTFVDSYPDVATEINSIIAGTKDTRVWTCSVKGDVSTRDAYDSLRSMGQAKSWGKEVWSPSIPPSRSMLFWRVIQGKVPTDDVVKKRGFSIPSRCFICGRSEETISHLFLMCPFAGALWDLIAYFFGLRPRTDKTLLDLWRDAMGRDFGSQIRNLWKSSIVSVIWIIWTTRNNRCYDGIEIPLRSSLTTLWRFIREAGLMKNGAMRNTMNDLQILSRLRVRGIPSRSPKVIEVNWHPPPPGWLKVNTDGATFGAPGLSGCAGIFRTSRSFVKGCFCAPLGVSYAYEAELAGAIHAIKYADRFGWKKIWLESDSEYVVNLFRNKSKMVPWRWLSSWTDCLDRIARMDFRCSHIYREGNSAADSLASRSPSICSATWWWDVPSFARHFTISDLVGRPSYRFC